MMAFAASSDLFTMTIANRVSLMLVGGFSFARRPDRDQRCRPTFTRRGRRGTRLRVWFFHARLDGWRNAVAAWRRRYPHTE